MRIRVHTSSGSVYVLDSEAATWERKNNRDILGFERNEGKLAFFPTVVVGQRMEFTDKDPSEEFEETPITSTQVVRVELI